MMTFRSSISCALLAMLLVWVAPRPASADTAAASDPSGPSAPASTSAAPAAPAVADDFSKGLTAYGKRDYAAAAERFTAAVNAAPQSAEAHFYLGYALYELKRFDEARQAFATAYQLKSDYKPPVP